MSPPVVEASALTRRFGAFVALDAVDLAVGGGETLAVFGPNGAGKTTLLRLLARAIRPSSGTIRLDGADERDDRLGRARVGFLSHHTFLYDDLTARDNLEFYARLHGVPAPAERAASLLVEVGLEERADEPVRSFSRGMQQRVALARALVHAPRLLLLDEPFSGLDPHAAARLRETLRGVRAGGAALVLTTHDVDEGLEIADRYLFLSRGRVRERGRSAEADRAALERRYAEAGG